MKTLILTITMFIACFSLMAQIDVKQKAKDKTIQRGDQKVDNGIDKTLDKLENGVKSIFKKKDKKKSAGEADENSESTDNDSNVATSADDEQDNSTINQNEDKKNNEKDKNHASPLTSYSKYDFVAGEKVLFYDDFSQDNVGDFPALWNTNGSAEIVTTEQFPGHWMKFNTSASIWTDELLKLPDNYTIEFDIVPIKGQEGSMEGYYFRMMQSINSKAYDAGSIPGKAGFSFNCAYYGTPSYRSYINDVDNNILDLNGNNDDKENKQIENEKYHIAIWVQKSRVRVYLNQNKLFDLPKALPGVNMDRIRFEEGAALVSNVRIAIGTPDMRNKLLTEGKLVTRGILFDSGSDKIKPESYGTLKEIAAILKESNVKVKIIGHTDSDGDDKMNLDLSQRRALSVKNALTKDFGINASTLESDGKGESEPVDNNKTIEGKANNRRVEFIKM